MKFYVVIDPEGMQTVFVKKKRTWWAVQSKIHVLFYGGSSWTVALIRRMEFG
jgi:hypothetical protein